MVKHYIFDGNNTKAINPGDLSLDDWIAASSGTKTAPELWQREPYLRRAVDVIARAVSDMPMEVLRGGEPVEIDLPLQTLLYQSAVSVVVNGYAYWLNTSTRSAIDVRWLSPGSIKPLYDNATGLVAFERTVGGVQTRLDVDSVIYLWQPAINTETGPGVAPITAALGAAGVLDAITSYSATFFERGAVFPMLLTIDGNPAENELRRLESWWRRLVQGVASAWQTIAVRASVKPEIIGPPVSDMAMPELTETQRQAIATALGVPHSLVMSNAANYATASQDYISFYALTVIPMARLIVDAINEQLLAARGLEIVLRPERLEAYQSQNLETGATLQGLVTSGIMTADEAREVLGLEPLTAPMLPEPEPEPDNKAIDDGYWFDHLWIDEVGKFERKALKSPGAVTFDSTIIADGELYGMIAALGHWPTKAARRELFAAWRERDIKEVLGYDDNVEPYQLQAELSFVPEMMAYLREQAGDLARYYDINGELPPQEEERNKLIAFLLPFITGWLLLEINRQAGLLGGVGLPVTADVNALAAEWANKYALKLARGLTDTTRALAKQAITAHLRVNGDINLQALIDELSKAIGPKWRAEMIAQTEVNRALNHAIEEVAREVAATGADAWLVYRTAQDERVCPVCAPMHGKKRRPGEAYDNGTPPPQHPRCRCKEYIEVV